MYIVAQGNSFITASGNIVPGEEIKESDFADKETFLKMVSRKRIVAGKSKEQREREAREKEAAAAKADTEKAVKKKEDAKTGAAKQLAAAETALKHAREIRDAAKEAADKISRELAASRRTELEKSAKEIEDCEKAAKDAEAAFKKAKPDQKETAEKDLLAATETLEAAINKMTELNATAVQESPELLAALESAERTEDALIEAEANLTEAKEAVAKAA